MNIAEVKDKVEAAASKAEKQDDIKTLEQEVDFDKLCLDNLVKNGGGQVLDKPENKLALEKMRQSMAASADSNDYKANLTAKKNYILAQIQMIKGDSGGGQLSARAVQIIKDIKKQIDQIDDVEKKKEYIKNNCQSRREGTIFPPGQAELKAIDDAEKKLNEMVDDANVVKNKNEEEVKKESDKAAKVPSVEVSNLSSFSAAEAMEKVNKTLSELPQTLMDQLAKVENILYQLVHGFPDLDTVGLSGKQIDLSKMIDSMIGTLQSLLDPVFSTATAISLPLPAIVAPVKQLIAQLPNLGKDPPGATPDMKSIIEKIKASGPKIPDSWKDILISLKDSLFQLVIMFPMCLINLIFSMIDAIIGQILALGGAAPYPLSLLPQAIQLMPKLIQLTMNFPESLIKALYKKLEGEVAKMIALGQSVDFSSIGDTIPAVAASPENLVSVKESDKKEEKKDESKESKTNSKDAMKAEEKSYQEAKNEALKQEIKADAQTVDPNNTSITS